MTSTYNQKCNKNADCASNVCEMIYENGIPKGRYCLNNTSGRYTKTCRISRDCLSGICSKIYDENGRFVTKRCVKAPKRDLDTPFNNLFGKERSNRYGILNDNTTQLKIGEAGPISEIIVKVFSIIGKLFGIIVYDFDKCSHDLDSQGIMYSILMRIIGAVFYGLLSKYDQGLIWGGIQAKTYDKSTNKCKANSRGIDMWYIRTIITILFPPLGVFMAKGLNGFIYILVSCFLTMMFYFPGLIYSFAVINASKFEIEEKIGMKLGLDFSKNKKKTK